MVRDSDDALSFRAKDFFIHLNDISGIIAFIYFLGSFVQVFSFNCVVVHERIYRLLFHFFFVKSLRLLDVFKTFPPLNTKNNQYTINLKHPLQTKIQLYWTWNASFSRRLKFVKVLYHKRFCKTVFQINLISKKKISKTKSK